MYETIFSLHARPFAAAPQAGRYVALGSADQSQQTLSRIIERAEGPGLLIGPAGSGKSLICQVLAEQFRGKFHIALLDAAGVESRRALLQSILFGLGLPYKEQQDADLHLSLISHLTGSNPQARPLLLLVDESHVLQPAVLEELRMLTNIMHRGESQVRLVLAGGPRLEEQFADPQLTSFNQRIAARCYLNSFNREETGQYVAAQLAKVGGEASHIFTEDAQEAIYTASDGIPRLINQIGDHAMMMAAIGGHTQISAAGVEEAWADLQQLPLPWRSTEESAPSAGVVEFGSLEDTVVDPMETIDTLQKHVDAVAQIEQPADEKADCSRNEISLEFHPAPNPFADTFEEEEVVIDRFASPPQVEIAAEVAAEQPEESQPAPEPVEIAPAPAEPVPVETDYSVSAEAPPELEVEEAETEEIFLADTQEHLEELAPTRPLLSIAPHSEETEDSAESTEEKDFTLVAVSADAEPAESPELEEPQEELVAESPTIELPSVIGADDVVMPEYADELVLSATAPEESDALEDAVDDDQPTEAEAPVRDDRDVIIVDDDHASPVKPPLAKGHAKRREYRQLFAQLRRG